MNKPFMYEGFFGEVEIVSSNKTKSKVEFMDIDGKVVFSVLLNPKNKDYTFEQFANIYGI